MKKTKALLASVLLAALVITLLTSAAMPSRTLEEEPAVKLFTSQEPELTLNLESFQTPQAGADQAEEPSQAPEPEPSPNPELPFELAAEQVPALRTAADALFSELWQASAPALRTAPVMMTEQAGGDHETYMSGADGKFLPDAPVSRRELAEALSALVTELPDSASVLYDVPSDDADIAAIQKAVGLDLMPAPDGLFRPNDPATHADCAYALASLLPYSAGETAEFPDVDADFWACEAISRTGGAGIFSGDEDGNFAPEAELKRWEQAAAFNRLLGRSADRVFVSQMPAFEFFTDVPADHPGYWDVLEAAVPHACAYTAEGGESWMSVDVKLLAEDGPRRINRRLYWVRDGAFVRDQSIGYLYFDSYGRYTTGNGNLDVRLNNIIEAYTNSSMTRDQKLRALFNYCRDYYTYLKRPLISKGQTGWEPDYALFFLNNGRGNCYCFSATYCLLCRNLGLQAYTVVGRALNSPHGWVEIELDGAVYLFDTQLEWRYLHDWGMRGYNFFKQPYYSTTVAYSR